MIMSFLFSFSILFIGLPWLVARFHREDDSWTDKLFICLIHSTLFFIVIVHLLAAVRLFETLSLIFFTFAGLFAAYRFTAGRNTAELRISILMGLYDITERPDNWKIFAFRLEENLRIRASDLFRRIRTFLYNHWPICLLVLTFCYAIYVRFKHSFEHLYFGSSDPYVHMKFAIDLSDNKLYSSGVYPYGFPAIITAMGRFFSMDQYIIVRFIGPICGVLLILSIYYAVRKIVGGNFPAIFLAVFVYTVYAGFPTYVWRQISAHPWNIRSHLSSSRHYFLDFLFSK